MTMQAHRDAAVRLLRNTEQKSDGFLTAGHWEIQVGDGPWEIAPNRVVDEGLMTFLSTTLAQQAQDTAFYIALFGGNVTPAAGWTAATFTASSTEFTNYTEPNRVLWAKGAAAANAIGNTATPAVFTMGVGGGTVRGAALISAVGKSVTTGRLIAAARFPADKVMTVGEELRVRYSITGTSA